MKDFKPKLSKKKGEKGLIEDLSQYAFDPLSFVYAAYPWGEGQLKGFSGPEGWQKEVLQEVGIKVRANEFNGVDPVDPLLFKIQSGRGIGKSAMGGGWLPNWIMSTRPHAKGSMTANTVTQIKTKTWSELRKWFGLSFTKHWFDVGAESVSHKKYKEWRLDIQTSNEENFNSFTGQHAINSTGFFILDESSTIPDVIWETMISGLTDGEPMVFAFGNPVINSGFFHNITRGPQRKYWYAKEVDSREVSFTNKKHIERQIEQYGADSDYVRIWILGKAPRADNLQCIPEELVERATKKRYKPENYYHAPIILGCDPAWQGSDPHVLGKRQGMVFWVLGAWRHLPYESSGFVTKIAQAIAEHRTDAEFVDQHGIGGATLDHLRQLGYEPMACNSQSTDAIRKDCANARTSMWLDMRDWLKDGGSIPDDEDLKNDLMAPYLFLAPSGKNAGKYILESKKDMKKRGIASPGRAEVLAYTFYQPVVRRRHTEADIIYDAGKGHGYLREPETQAENYDFKNYR